MKRCDTYWAARESQVCARVRPQTLPAPASPAAFCLRLLGPPAPASRSDLRPFCWPFLPRRDVTPFPSAPSQPTPLPSARAVHDLCSGQTQRPALSPLPLSHCSVRTRLCPGHIRACCRGPPPPPKESPLAAAWQLFMPESSLPRTNLGAHGLSCPQLPPLVSIPQTLLPSDQPGQPQSRAGCQRE